MGETHTDRHRLPTTARPSEYDLRLRIDPNAEGFSGEVTILLELDEDLRELTLHALDLEICSVGITDSSGAVHDPEVVTEHDREWIILRPGSPLPAGATQVHLSYSGRYCDNLVGLYTSEFDFEGRTERLAVSQCESTHARRILPCFDEPAFKASFAVTLEVPEGSTAVSNGAEVGREALDAATEVPMVAVRFAPTIPMSSYLLALVVGPLEVTDAPSVPGREGPIPLRVIHPPGQSHLTGFAIEVATAALGFFEDYYDLPLPGDKVDLVAIPDFAFGAMENLGCITFREVLLLVEPEAASPLELQRVADVINHELAHMWFGNLVTMSWWNGIWLNEAFATFMEISASDSFRPEWDVWTTFGLARSAAFDTDALVSTRPIEFEVRTAADSEAMFDILTYEKGASVLRMFEQYLGPEAFRDGIRSYLRRHAYGNTDTADLWRALEESTGEPVERIAESWIFRGGHPLVSVEPVEESSAVHLSQRRALYRADAEEGASERPYPVPMTLVAGGEGHEGTQRLILESRATLELPSGTDRLRVNPGGSGFFRTLLPTDLRNDLLTDTDSPLERFVLLDDTWFCVLAGALQPLDALDALATVAGSGALDPSLWRRVTSILSELDRLVAADQRERLQGWTRELLNPVLSEHPPLRCSGRTGEVAATVMAALGTTGADPEAKDLAVSVFDSGPTAAYPAVAAAALDVVAREPDESRYEEIRRRWRQAATPQEEQRHLAALVATSDPNQFASALESCLGEVRSQDAPYTLRRALSNRDRGAEAWAFIEAHHGELRDRLPSGSLPRMLEGIRTFTDGATARRVEDFLLEHPLPSGTRQVEQHLERMWATVEAAERMRAAELFPST
ncbi:MAG: M1 family metallopeptidase [Microthrixaceae bacterium]|nr:M1 family metallopeptidase [Microthrixaceae bacterium]